MCGDLNDIPQAATTQLLPGRPGSHLGTGGQPAGPDGAAGVSVGLWLCLGSLLGDDLDAQVDAFVADVDAGAGDQLVDLALGVAAKRAPQVAVSFLALAARLLNRIGCPSWWVLSLTAGGGRVAGGAAR